MMNVIISLVVVILLFKLIYLFFKFLFSLSKTPEQREKEKRIEMYGAVNPVLICPHCQAKGVVHTNPVTLKKGVSGAKATGAVLTAGISLLATGLSRKEDCTQAHCANCNSTWVF